MKRKVLPCFMALSMTLTAAPNVAMAEDGSMNEAETVVETTVETEPAKESAGEVGAPEVVDTTEETVVEAVEIQPAMVMATAEVAAENGQQEVKDAAELKAAVENAADGVETTIRLTADIVVAEPMTVKKGQNIILDMDGHEITVTDSFVSRIFTNNGTLTIKGNGTIDVTAAGADGYGAVNNFGTLTVVDGTYKALKETDAYIFYNRSGGTVIFENPTVEGGCGAIATQINTTTEIHGGSYSDETYPTIENRGEMLITGGTFKNTSCSSCDGKWGYTIRSGESSDTAYLKIQGETEDSVKVTGVQGGLAVVGGTADIYNGSYVTEPCKVHTNGASAFYAGYFTGESYKTSTNIYGGTFQSASKNALQIGNGNPAPDSGNGEEATVMIYGGTFVGGDAAKTAITVNETQYAVGAATIKGGNFSSDVEQWLASGMLQGEDGTVIVNPNNAAQIGDEYYESLSDAIAQAETGETIVLLKDVTEDITVNKNITIDGQDQFTISGNTKLQNGTLQNLTLTTNQAAPNTLLTIGSTEKNAIKMDHVTVKYPVTGTSAGTASVAGNNNADITITGCTFMNEANNNGVTEDAAEWSYGLYMNDQGTGSFTFTKSKFDGAFRTMLANINGSVSITDNEFVNCIFSNNSGSTSGSGEEATCITTAKAEVNDFTITGNTFDNAGAFYFQRTAGATVTGNTFKFDKFEHFIQVKGVERSLDLTENTFEMGDNDLIIVDVVTTPIKLPAGQKAVSYWVWVETNPDESQSSYVYAYNEDGSVTFYPGTQAAMDAFLNPASGNIGMTKDDTLYVEGELELKQNITEGQLVVSGNGQLNVSEGVEIADDALAMEPGAKVTGLKKDISDSIEVPDGYKLVVTKDENGEYTYTLQKKSSGGSHRYDGYITIINPKNGTVSVSDDWADEDQKITLTITPDKGYVVDKIEIVDAEGDKIDAKKVEDKDDKYTFRMANCDVTVTVTFKEEGKTEDKEETTTEETETEETTKPETITFSDVKESDWFYKGVSYVVENGMMNGVGNDQFAPNAPLTREMLAVVLYNMEKQPESTGVNPFADVKADMWYTDAIVWANANGIVAGYDDSTFGLGDSITREQLATILYRYAQLKGYDVTEKADLTGYTDSTAISGYAVEAMQWANANGIVNGMTETTLAPQDTATRAQVATMLMNFCENVATKAE